MANYNIVSSDNESTVEDAEWVKSTWFGILLTLAILALTVSIFSIIPKILGTKFEKTNNIIM